MKKIIIALVLMAWNVAHAATPVNYTIYKGDRIFHIQPNFPGGVDSFQSDKYNLYLSVSGVGQLISGSCTVRENSNIPGLRIYVKCSGNTFELTFGRQNGDVWDVVPWPHWEIPDNLSFTVTMWSQGLPSNNRTTTYTCPSGYYVTRDLKCERNSPTEEEKRRDRQDDMRDSRHD